MKFIELKKDLEKNIRPAYLINGNDRYLCYNALEMIKKALGITLVEMNEVIMSGDSVTKEDIARSASIFPFADNYRLIQVNDYSAKAKSKLGGDELLDYLKNPMNETVLVFFNLEGTDALKPYMQYLTAIDCDKLDESTIRSVLASKVAKSGAKMSREAIDTLVLYCNNDMARITSELDKLICFAGEKEITKNDVSSLVVQDKEYQVYELAEFIARGEKVKALDLIFTLSKSGYSGFSLLTPLYNNYRRALFVAINKDKADDEIASLLGVKPYAIKMVKNQVRYFTPKKLKTIVDMLYEADRNIKTGKIKEEVAIKTVTLNILNIRG
ncbi:MAG: DNA polymerase III subunit delta [Clostridia bacterium]|nr:DNA polymerase III subunit delta [Clostridia bacterium]